MPNTKGPGLMSEADFLRDLQVTFQPVKGPCCHTWLLDLLNPRETWAPSTDLLRKQGARWKEEPKWCWGGGTERMSCALHGIHGIYFQWCPICNKLHLRKINVPFLSLAGCYFQQSLTCQCDSWKVWYFPKYKLPYNAWLLKVRNYSSQCQ